MHGNIHDKKPLKTVMKRSVQLNHSTLNVGFVYSILLNLKFAKNVLEIHVYPHKRSTLAFL